MLDRQISIDEAWRKPVRVLTNNSPTVKPTASTGSASSTERISMETSLEVAAAGQGVVTSSELGFNAASHGVGTPCMSNKGS